MLKTWLRIRTWSHVYKQTSMQISYIFTRPFAHTHMYARTHWRTQMRTHVNNNVRARTQIRTIEHPHEISRTNTHSDKYTHTRRHRHIHIQTNAHTCTCFACTHFHLCLIIYQSNKSVLYVLLWRNIICYIYKYTIIFYWEMYTKNQQVIYIYTTSLNNWVKFSWHLTYVSEELDNQIKQ